MDSIDFKFDKANSILRFRILGKMKIANLFRFIELCIFFVIIVSKFSTHLPLAFNPFTYAEFLRQAFSATFISPRFIFLLGNAIVFVLFLRSGQFSNRDGTETSNSKADLYSGNCEKYSIRDETKAISDVCNRKGRKMQRSCSEKSKRVDYGGRKLNRSATDICRQRIEKSPKNRGNCYYSADEMSSEEFRRTVEDFIARRQRCLMEEELSATVY